MTDDPRTHNLLRAFPDFDNVEFFVALLDKLEPLGFEDTSWKNDANPSISWYPFPDGECDAVRVWVEYKNPEMREFEHTAISRTANDGGDTDYVQVNRFDADLVYAIAAELQRQLMNDQAELEIVTSAMGFIREREYGLVSDDEAEFFDVEVRCKHPTKDGLIEVLLEYENLKRDEAEAIAEQLEHNLPNAGVEFVTA